MGGVQRLHLVVGLAALVFFAGTGLYLRFREPAMASTDLGPRMLLRAGHIYLLFSGLLNVVAGLRSDGRNASRVGSVLILSSSVLLAVGFCMEAARSALERPLTTLGVFVATIGVLLQFIGFLVTARKSRH
jgi:hypothetical protein